MRICIGLLLSLAACGLVACGGGSPVVADTTNNQEPGAGSEPEPDPGASDPEPEPLQNPRPAGSPDVLLLSVAGHSGALAGLFCDDGENRAYLADEGRAVDAVVQVFVALDLSVEVHNFADRLRARDDDGDGIPDRADQLGFVELLAKLDQGFEDWVQGFDNPTRIVLVAHSHGTNWSHILAAIRPEIEIDIQITLDGICFLFECEHEDAVADFIAQRNEVFPLDFSRPCDSIDVLGFSDPFNVKDVAFPNVVAHLEVQSSDFFVSDATDNFRIDGTEVGIARLASSESHTGVTFAGGEAMNWVQDRILEVLFVG